MTDVVIAALSPLPATVLGQVAIAEALTRARVEAAEVTEVILGQVLTAAQGQNPARQAALGAGVPIEKTALTVNQVCGSAMRAVALGYQAIRVGDGDIVVAGGQESMSQAPHAAYLRTGTKMGPVEFIDTMVKDGLWCAANGYHMGNTAENVAERWQITRDEQDAFACGSQNKAEAAQKAGRFKDEIVTVTIPGRKGDTVVEDDEYPRHGTVIENLAKLRPAFAKDGTITAGNASGINDGAAALVLMRADEADKRGLAPLARMASIRRSWARARFRPAARRWRRPAGRSTTSTSSRPTRPSPPRPSPSTGISAWTFPRSTSTAGRSPSGIRSGPQARGF
jgi:acetyl-CoA C-acetyltransferase